MPGRTYETRLFAESRRYSITVGTRPRRTAAERDPKIVAGETISEWMRETADSTGSLPLLITEGTAYYTKQYRDESPTGPVMSEPVLLMQGVVPRNVMLDDTAVKSILNEIASRLGNALDQDRVYMEYKSLTWVMQSN